MFYANEFLNHLKNCRYSRKTIREYGYVLKHLKNHFERGGINDVTGSLKAGCANTWIVSSTATIPASTSTSESDGWANTFNTWKTRVISFSRRSKIGASATIREVHFPQSTRRR